MEQIHGGDVYRHPNVLDFSANMNPLGTPESVVAAAVKGLQRIEHYPDVENAGLLQALSAYEQVPKEWLICGNGAAELIFTLALALKPKKAMLTAPTFAEYEQALKAVDTKIVYHMLEDKNGFLPGEAFLNQLSDERPELLILCNPNNPTGVLPGADFMERVRSICKKEQIFLMVDECFLDFADDHAALTQVPHIAKQSIFVLKAFTKRYAMAGIRLGYGVCADLGVLERMHQVTQPWNISIPAQEAGVAALKETAYVRMAAQLIAVEREYLKGELSRMGLSVYDSAANYVFFRGPKGMKEKLLQENILIRDCSNYQGLKDGYYRVAVRLRKENRLLLDAIRKGVE